MRIALLVVPVIVLACSSGSDSGEGASSSFIQQYCQELTPCCGPADKDGKVPGSGCVTIYSFFSAAATYDGAAGTACLNEIHTAKADPSFCTKVSKVAPSCKRVFKANTSTTGTVQPGGECKSDNDCAASAEGEANCSFDRSTPGASSKMVCQIEMPGKPGDGPCMGTKLGSATTYESGNGAPPKAYVCDVATSYCSRTTKKCEAIKAVGADCSGAESYACGDRTTASCDYATKKCTALKADGQACERSTECASSYCQNKSCAVRTSSSSSGTDTSLILVCSKTD